MPYKAGETAFVSVAYYYVHMSQFKFILGLIIIFLVFLSLVINDTVFGKWKFKPKNQNICNLNLKYLMQEVPYTKPKVVT